MAGRSTNQPLLCCKYHPKATLLDDYHTGDMICSECGLVVCDRLIDESSEWRTFAEENGDTDPCRVGAAENPLLDGNDLSTVISTSTKAAASDESGIPKYKSRTTTSSSDRALIKAFNEINDMAHRINLPKSIADRANELFKKVHDNQVLKGRNNMAVAVACLYIGCRMEGVPRTFKELCAVTTVSKKIIGRYYKSITKELGTRVDSVSGGDFMSRFCANLELSPCVRRAAMHIAQKAVELNLVPGRNPTSVAATAIFMASEVSENKKTHKEISDVTGVAESTIRQIYKLMYPSAEQLFPEGFKFKTEIASLPQV